MHKSKRSSFVDRRFFFAYRKVSQSSRDGGVEAESTIGPSSSNDSPATSKQSVSFGSLEQASQALLG
jgi:hypothetical protein